MEVSLSEANFPCLCAIVLARELLAFLVPLPCRRCRRSMFKNLVTTDGVDCRRLQGVLPGGLQ